MLVVFHIEEVIASAQGERRSAVHAGGIPGINRLSIVNPETNAIIMVAAKDVSASVQVPITLEFGAPRFRLVDG